MEKTKEADSTTSPYRTPTNERENIPELALEGEQKRKASAMERKESDQLGTASNGIDLNLITNKLQDHLVERDEKGDILKSLNLILDLLKQEMRFPTGLTFDDVLLVPQHSNINSRSEVSLTTRFSRNVKLNIPFVSSPMDTVTEADMAIEMARNGGIGIIHRFMSIEEQVKQIEKVKKKEAHIINNPYSVEPTETCGDVLKLREQLGIDTLIVVEKKLNSRVHDPKVKTNWIPEKIIGILTRRDLNVKKKKLFLTTFLKLSNISLGCSRSFNTSSENYDAYRKNDEMDFEGYYC
jgi:CBS domain-containing protein